MINFQKTKFYFQRPSAFISRTVDNLVIKEKNSPHISVKAICSLGSVPLSTLFLPLALITELFLKHLPKISSAYLYKNQSLEHQHQFQEQKDLTSSVVLGILFAPFVGIRAPHLIPSFFLETPPSNTEIRPYGNEDKYGKKVLYVYEPKTVNELIEDVQLAKRSNRQVTIIGAGMSQGLQTIPTGYKKMPIRMSHLNGIEIDAHHNTVKVQAGATLEELQLALNAKGKSMLVKQASDAFSIGGTIGANAHGWAHQLGSFANTVESLEVINSDGELVQLNKDDEMFGCMFGTWGYFGVVVSATIRITDNIHLCESSKEIELEDFLNYYETKIKSNPDIPLFGGRLILDQTEGLPLRNICMVSYSLDNDKNLKAKSDNAPIITENFYKEPSRGTRLERVSMMALSHVTSWTARYMIALFWANERESMLKGRNITRNEALHPPINAMRLLQHSNINAQWLQEYFINPNHLAPFLRYLGAELKANGIQAINATIRPVVKDTISILPYAKGPVYAAVICFQQFKHDSAVKKTQLMIENITKYLVETGNTYYQAYMPYATREQFEECYGKDQVAKMRLLKKKYDPQNLFGNAHTEKYYTEKVESPVPIIENSVEIEAYKLANERLKPQVTEFLERIFQQVDAKKFMQIFEEVMQNPDLKTGMDVYAELLKRSPEAQGSLLFKVTKGLKALRDERDNLLANVSKISDAGFSRNGGVLEINLPARHIKGIVKEMSLRGNSALANDKERPSDIVQRGLFKPYKTFVPLSAEHEPLIKEQFNDPISVIIMAAGIHHCPKDNLKVYVQSLYDILEPGGIFLLRDHDASNDERKTIADMAHRTFNALTGVTPEDEALEIRNFESLDYFIKIVESCGFKLASKPLMREGDPTLNQLIKFYKPLDDKAEGQIGYIRELMINTCKEGVSTKTYVRDLMQSHFTKVEWGNVESEVAQANFFKDHVFWKYPHFRDAMESALVYSKSFSAARKTTSTWKVITSSYNVMNSTIVVATATQNIIRGTFNALLRIASIGGYLLPDRQDPAWQAPEKYLGQWADEYSQSLEVIPAYEHPYAQKLSQFFKILNSSYADVRETRSIASILSDRQTYKNIATAVAFSGDMIWRQMFASMVKVAYGSQEDADAREIGLIIKANDVANPLTVLGQKISKSITEEGNPYQGIVVPRYRQLTEVLKLLSDQDINVIEIAGQKTIEIEFEVKKGEAPPQISEGQVLYKRKHLSDNTKTIYACSVPVGQLNNVFKEHDKFVHRVYDY